MVAIFAPFASLGFVAGTNLDDSRFTSAQLLAAETLLASCVQAFAPSLDVSPGSTLYELLRPRALTYLLSKAEVQTALATGSLAAVTADPELASDAVVDAICSNWGVTRHDGSVATGTVKVSVARNTVYGVPATQTFVAPQGQTFVPTQSFVALVNPTLSNHLKLYAADANGDQFYFLVPVVARAVGLASQLGGATALNPAPAIPNLVNCVTFGEFSGGVDAESSAALIARLPDGLSAKNLVSRASLRSVIRAAFPALQSLTVQGFGDPALQRGGDNILGVKTPGRADVWVRTLPGLETRTISTVPATRVSLNADGTASYVVSLSAAQTGGAYLVAAVLPAGSGAADAPVLLGTYALGTQSRGYEPAVPETDRVQSAAEAAYSVYGTLNCPFTLAPTDGTLEAVVAVDVQVVGQPNLADIQSLVDDPDTRAAGTDYLVRAAIPCFCALSPVTVYADSSVDPANLRTTLYAAITGTPPGTPLTVDALVVALRGVAGVSRVDLPIRLAGRIYAPDGTTYDLQSQNALVVPSVPASSVVPETVAWFVSMDDLPLNVIYG